MPPFAQWFFPRPSGLCFFAAQSGVMKYFFLVATALLGIFSLAFSKKQRKAPGRTDTIARDWRGAFSLDEGPFVNAVFFECGEDNRLKVYEGDKTWGDVSEGNYMASGDSIVFIYHHLEGIQDNVTIQARIVDGNRLEGSWLWSKGKGKIMAFAR